MATKKGTKPVDVGGGMTYDKPACGAARGAIAVARGLPITEAA